MCIIGCTTVLELDGHTVEAKNIIEKVKAMNKYRIDYGNPLRYIEKYENGKLRKIEIDFTNDIDASITKGGIYFIFSGDGNRLLYIGKSKDLKNRLKQHLIACTLSTYSHIQDVLNYLKEQKIRKEKLVLQYCIINSVDDKHNAAIEGALIDYIQENKENEVLLSDCWNTRHD